MDPFKGTPNFRKLPLYSKPSERQGQLKGEAFDFLGSDP